MALFSVCSTLASQRQAGHPLATLCGQLANAIHREKRETFISKQTRTKHLTMHFIQSSSHVIVTSPSSSQKNGAKNEAYHPRKLFARWDFPGTKRETERGLLFVCSDKFIGCDRFFAARPEREWKAKIGKIKTRAREKERQYYLRMPDSERNLIAFLALHSPQFFPCSTKDNPTKESSEPLNSSSKLDSSPLGNV